MPKRRLHSLCTSHPMVDERSQQFSLNPMARLEQLYCDVMADKELVLHILLHENEELLLTEHKKPILNVLYLTRSKRCYIGPRRNVISNYGSAFGLKVAPTSFETRRLALKSDPLATGLRPPLLVVWFTFIRRFNSIFFRQHVGDIASIFGNLF